MKSSFLWSISALTAPYRPRLPSASQLRFLSTRSAINRGLNRSTRDRGSRNTEVHRNDNRAALKPWERASSDHSPFIRNKSPSRSRSGDHRSDFRRQSQSSSQTYYEPDARDDIKPRRAFGSRGTAINGNARSQIEFKPSKSRDVAPWKTSRRPTNQDAPMRRHMEGRYESPPNDMMRREPSTRRTHDHGVSEYEGLSRNREGIDHDQPRRLERGPRSPPRTVVPMNVTYTTPASEFLYGTSSVKAALASRRRQFYKLYICGGEDRVNPQQDDALERFAERYGVPTLRVTQEWSPLMDKMSSGRPHNGYVLEASPLPKMPITCLESVSRPGEPFSVAASHQSREEVLVNGMDNRVKYDAPYSRYPFILMLDGILDPGNLGGIVRSAYFLGADAIVISSHSSPLGPVAIKASAGAVEHIPLFAIHKTGGFMEMSQKNGWHFYASVAPPSRRDALVGVNPQPHSFTTALGNPLQHHPCVLMLGGEGAGIRPDLQKRADHLVSIAGQRSGRGGVDSLNVSVAGGVLCDAFLRQPTAHSIDPQASSNETSHARFEGDLF